MAYITNTLTSSNPSADLYTALAGALTTAGFTLVDTVVISTRTHKIWKSAAANNAAAVDWYLEVVYATTGSGNLALLPMEFFDPATDLAYRTVFGGTSSVVIDATTGSRWGATGQTLESANLALNASTLQLFRVPTQTTSFGYWISVTGDRVIALSSVEADRFVYAGTYTPSPMYAAQAGAALYPLIVVRPAYNGIGNGSAALSGNTISFTRISPATSLAGSGWGDLGGYRPFWSGASAGYPVFPGVPSDATTLTGGRYASPIRIDAHNSWAAPAAGGGWIGTLIDVAHMRTAASVVRGDTVTIGADTWVLTSNGGGSSDAASVLFKAV